MCVSSLTTSVKPGVKCRDIGNEIHRHMPVQVATQWCAPTADMASTSVCVCAHHTTTVSPSDTHTHTHTCTRFCTTPMSQCLTPAALHHAPLLPAENKTIGVMKPGHTFTIEPMISEGTWKDVTRPDSWTASTMVREHSVSITHTWRACCLVHCELGSFPWPHPQHMPSQSAKYEAFKNLILYSWNIGV